MWQYSTETIINTNNGNLDGGKRAVIYNNQGSVTTATPVSTDTLIIDGVNSFVLKNIKHITKHPYRAASPAVATLTVVISPSLTATNPDGVYRLTVDLKEEGRVSSYMQDAYLRHKKPFHYEVPVNYSEQPSAIATKLVNVIKKDLAMTDFKYFTVSANGAVLTFTGADNHIRFANAPDLVLVDDAPTGSAERMTGYQNFSNVATGTITAVGDCGAGTVEHLIKDLRIPTNATINPFAPDNGGRPIPGGKYDQYLIEYETKRHHVAGGVMGSVNEVSRTSHVVFLEQTGASEIANIITGIGNVCSAWGGEYESNYAPTGAEVITQVTQVPGSVQ